MNFKIVLGGVVVGVLVTGCDGKGKLEQPGKKIQDTTKILSSITKEDWGIVDGKNVYLYTLKNKNNIVVKITNYGGIITEWICPDRNGKRSSIVLGFSNLEGYLDKPPYFGAIIGRYANRIAGGKFIIDGKEYQLAHNDGNNHLHGGNKGFDKVVWDAVVEPDSLFNNPTLTLRYLSPDGEEGYPGNLQVQVRYILTHDDELQIEYVARTDKATPVNLTNHSYFNLTGDVTRSILNHRLKIGAINYTPVNNELIPTGELKQVSGTAFDFQASHKIGERIDQVPGGYDHNFSLLQANLPEWRNAGILEEEQTGRQIEVFTTEPGIQFYSGNFLDGSIRTSDGKKIGKYSGLCLETQHYPNSPNQANFPSTILRPGQVYQSKTSYKFSIYQ